MPIVHVALLVAPIVQAPPLPEPGSGAPRTSGHVRGDRRVGVRLGPAISLPGDDRDLALWSVRAEASAVFRDGLAIVGAVDGLAATGDVATGETVGAGASALLRWHFVDRPRWSAFVDFGLGLVGTSEEFPPGGTELNGSREVSLGLSVRVSEALDLVAGVRQQHVSNGRGVVDDNPSFDGLGGYVGLTLPLERGRPAASPAPRRPDAGAAWPWSVRVDARGGRFDDEGSAGARADVDVGVAGPVRVQVEAAQDDLDGESLDELGATLYLNGRRGRAGVAYDRRELGVFHTDGVEVFGEAFLDDVVSAVGVLAYEDRNLSPDRWLGGLFLRTYPFESLMVEAGPGFAVELGESAHVDAIDLAIAIEFLPPLLERVGLSIYAEERIDDVELVGLRWQIGGAGSLRCRQRAGGVLRRSL